MVYIQHEYSCLRRFHVFSTNKSVVVVLRFFVVEKRTSKGTFLPKSPSDSILTAVTASTAISAKKELSGPRILELIEVLAAFTRFGLI